jgi:signal transduction histidine kinase
MGGMSLLDEALAALNNGNDYGHVVKVINSGTQRLYRLTQQTSILGELVSGYAAMHWEQLSQPTTLNNVVKEALTTIESHAAEKQVELDIQLGSELAIFGINTMLVKGIYEILHNGVQYSEPGQIVTVQTYATDDDRAVIQVDDQGRGILAEDVDRVWDLMVQSERGKYEHQGLGLGLTLTRGIFEVHKGDAQLESVHGEGTTVWLSLPIYQE